MVGGIRRDLSPWSDSPGGGDSVQVGSRSGHGDRGVGGRGGGSFEAVLDGKHKGGRAKKGREKGIKRKILLA